MLSIDAIARITRATKAKPIYIESTGFDVPENYRPGLIIWKSCFHVNDQHPLQALIALLHSHSRDLSDTAFNDLLKRSNVYPAHRERFQFLLRGAATRPLEETIPQEANYEKRRFFSDIVSLFVHIRQNATLWVIIDDVHLSKPSVLSFLKHVESLPGSANFCFLFIYPPQAAIGDMGDNARSYEFEDFLFDNVENDRLIHLFSNHPRITVLPELSPPEPEPLVMMDSLYFSYCWPELESCCNQILGYRQGNLALSIDAELQANYYLCLSQEQQKNHDLALVQTTKLLTLAKSYNLQPWVSRALRTASRLYYLHNDHELALKLANEAFNLAQASGHKLESALANLEILSSAAATTQVFRSPKALEEIFDRTLSTFAELGWNNHIALLASNPLYLMHLWRSDRKGQAQVLCQQSIKLSRRAKNQYRLAEAFHAEGLLSRSTGNSVSAHKSYQRAIRAGKLSGGRLEYTRILNGYGYFNFTQGKFTKALPLYWQALNILQEVLFVEELCTTLVNIALCYTFTFNHAEATIYLESCLRVMNRLKIEDLPYHPRPVILALTGFNLVCLGQGNRGREYLSRIQRHESLFNTDISIRGEYEYLLQAVLAVDQADIAATRTCFDRLFACLALSPDENQLLQLFVLLEFNRCLQQLGETAETQTIVDRAQNLRTKLGIVAYDKILNMNQAHAAPNALPLPFYPFNAETMLAFVSQAHNLTMLHHTILELNVLNELQSILFAPDSIKEALIASIRMISTSFMFDACIIMTHALNSTDSKDFVYLEQSSDFISAAEQKKIIARFPLEPFDAVYHSVFSEFLIIGQEPESPTRLDYFPFLTDQHYHGYLLCLSRKGKAEQSPKQVLSIATQQIALALELHQAHARLEANAKSDELTGLHNRRSIREIIDGELKRYSRSRESIGSTCCLLYLDLDNFKTYNDLFGHKTGDFILKLVSLILQESTRDIDFLSRMGGDEFVVLLTDCRKTTASIIATRILNGLDRNQKAIADYIENNFRGSLDVESTGNLTCSIGLLEYRAEESWGLDEFLHRADRALYQAKNAGKNRAIIGN